jgi:hypothetical protein
MTLVIALYGLTDPDIDKAAETLAQIVDIPFEPHESSFWGGILSGSARKSRTRRGI